MKKILTPCLIACALTISTNSFGMLKQTARRKAFVQRRYLIVPTNISDLEKQKFIEQADKIDEYANKIQTRNKHLLGLITSQNRACDNLKQLTNNNRKTIARPGNHLEKSDYWQDRISDLEKQIKE